MLPADMTLARLLESQGLDGNGQAVAVDNNVVPRSMWTQTPVTDGMRITVIKAVCGG